MEDLLLEVKDLNIEFHDHLIPETVVYDFDLTLQKGEIVGLVGESGSGKSMSALAIAGLLSRKDMKKRGEILFEGKELLTCSRSELRKIQGNDIGIIFQEPMTSLNPVKRIGWQVEEALRIHTDLDKQQRYDKVIKMLKEVELADAERVYRQYPHELSGGMRQRVMIAAAMICEPKLLIADEPTTALDVTIQAQILRILKKLAEESDTSVILITHDMGVVAEMADHVMVMYAGKSVEYGTAEDIFDHPMHPYTVGLLKSIPKLGSGQEDHLFTIEGTVPGLDEMPEGCRFSTRCPYATEQCKKEDPGMQGEAGHFVRCFRFMDPEIQDSREVE